MKVITSNIASLRSNASRLIARLSAWSTQLQSPGNLSQDNKVQAMGLFAPRSSRLPRPQPVPPNPEKKN
ncbi:MAG: hypothetical protein WA949_12650 [Phormidesmis sp.]